MHRTIINENTARAARRQHPLSEYTPRENDQFVEANHEAATDIALKRVQETVKQRFGDDFTIEEKYCTPDLLVFKKGLTRYIVKHGASSGLGETFTGDKINAYDEESYELAYKNAENKTGQRYPELDEVMRKFNKDGINLKNVETVGYSNASPQMLYLNKNYGIRTTIFDGVVGQAQLKDIRNGLPAEAHMVSLTSGAPAQDIGRLYYGRQIPDPLTKSDPSKNLKVTKIKPVIEDSSRISETLRPELFDSSQPVSSILKKPVHYVKSLHTIEQYRATEDDYNLIEPEPVFGMFGGQQVHPDSDRIKFDEDVVGRHSAPTFSRVEAVKAGVHAVKGVATGLGAGAIVHGIAPNMNREATTAVTAGTNLVLDSTVATGAAGVMTRSAGKVLSTAGKSMGEGALPMLAAYEAADHFGDLMDLISNGGYSANVSKPIKIADTIAVGGGAGAATLAAQTRALRAIRLLRAGRIAGEASEGAEGIELAEGVEAGAEVAGEVQRLRVKVQRLLVKE